MNLFDNSYLDLTARISEDFVMMPIKLMGPISETRKSLESLDTLIDEPLERHSDKEFYAHLFKYSMPNVKGVNP